MLWEDLTDIAKYFSATPEHHLVWAKFFYADRKIRIMRITYGDFYNFTRSR